MESRLSQEAHKLRATLRLTKHLVYLTNVIVVLLLAWQVLSSYAIHQSYQNSLMDRITDRILDDYQQYFVELRLKLDLFQQQNSAELASLDRLGKDSDSEAYMALLAKLRKDVELSRLFAFVDESGRGSLSHITGDFLPHCKQEIESTIKAGGQEQLFLHHSSRGVHFDILQPLNVPDGQNLYLFASFNADVLQDILGRYQLPHQQLFLLRTDNVGKIELSSDDVEVDPEMVMSATQLETFNFLKPIPNTRWQLAIRLDENYNNNIIHQGIYKAFAVWLLLSVCMYAFYRLQKSRTQKYLSVAQQAIFTDEHDKLTALVNRTQFKKELSGFIENEQRDANLGVALQVDIDQFQLFNSSYGYTFGDALLASLSSRFTEFFPENAIVSRLGNDEFAVFTPDLDHQSARQYAEKLRGFIQDLTLHPGDKTIHVTACIGVVILDSEQVDSERVLLSLGQAVAIAKTKGRNRVQIYQSDEADLLQHAEEMRVIQSLELAVRNNTLALFKQKIAPLNAQNDEGHYEVLVRMVSREGDYVPPLRFVPVAEKYGMVHLIDLWVIEKTCELIKQDHTAGLFSINLSGKTLADKKYTDTITAIVERYGIEPKQLAFEITETAAIGDLPAALTFIQTMGDRGHKFYLDDFGSGLSSFSYLQKLPVDVIKIDGSFVMDLMNQPVNRVLVENIQRIAAAMGKETIAECVESDEIAAFLRDLGIDYAQGFHFHKPEIWYQV